MNDPFDTLRAELVMAAARAERASPRRRWGWLRGRSRPLAVVIAALVVCGSAAAAVVSLTAHASHPLTGRVPGRVAPAQAGGGVSVAGLRYSIYVTPSLSTGSAGWEVSTTYRASAGGLLFGGGGGGGYPTRADPIFQGGGVLPFGFSPPPARGDSVGFVVTGPQVAAVRIGTRTTATFASALLPARDRAAVFFIAPGAPTPEVGWRPGQPVGSHTVIPGLGSGGGQTSRSVATTAVIPLDHAGNRLPTRFPNDDGFLVGWSFWQAPSAVTPQIQEPPYHGRTRPRPGACGLAQRGLPGLVAEWGSTITGVGPVRDAVGELFLSCVANEYYFHGWPLTAAVLLDARHPSAAPGPIPGALPVPGTRSLVDFAGASLSARRVGNAWLIVKGGSGTAQRIRVLEALRISRLERNRVGR